MCPQALVTLPDGRKAQVTFDTQEQLDATIHDLTQTPGQPKGGAPRKTNGEASGAEKPWSAADLPALGRTAAAGAGEAALKMGSGLVAGPISGIAGLARGAGAGLASLVQGEGLTAAEQAFADEGASTVQAVGEAGTYQPRTAAGRGISGVIETPFRLLGSAGDTAGRAATDVTGSPLVGAGVNAVIQSLPAILGARVRAGRAAPAAGETGAAGEAAAGGEVPRGTPPPEGGPAPKSAPDTPDAKAESYARSIGLDWSRLASNTKSLLSTIAKGSGDFSKLDSAAVKRQALLDSLRVPVRTTRAKLTQNATDLRREAIVSKTDVGEPIRAVDVAANRDIQANLEALRGVKAGKRGGLHDPNEEGAPEAPSLREETKRPEEVGTSLQGELRGKAAASKRNYDALYEKARQTEPDVRASVQPLHDLLTKNPEIQHLGWVSSWLGKAAKARQLATGAEEVTKLEDATLAELHDLRSEANDIAATGGKEGLYAKRVAKTIDNIMAEATPAGAKAWKEANTAYRKHMQEFKDQGIIRKLVTDKGGDRAVALEKTAEVIHKGSLEQIRQVKQSLLTQEGGSNLRLQGRRAWRDLQAETVNRILEKARDVTGSDEAGRPLLTAVALRKSINAIGRDRLTEILGKRTTDELYRILRATNITAKGRVTESGTVPNALVLMEKATKHLVPGAKYVIGAKEGLKTLGERGKTAADAREATVTPLQRAAAESERRAEVKVKRKRRKDTTLGAIQAAGAADAAAPTIGQTNQQGNP